MNQPSVEDTVGSPPMSSPHTPSGITEENAPVVSDNDSGRQVRASDPGTQTPPTIRNAGHGILRPPTASSVSEHHDAGVILDPAGVQVSMPPPTLVTDKAKDPVGAPGESQGAPRNTICSVKSVSEDRYGMLPIEEEDFANPPSNTLLYIESRREILLPCYVAVVMKRMRNLQELEQCCDMSTTIVMRINYGDLPQEVKEELVKNIKFRINESEYQLSEIVSEPKWKGSLFVTTLRMDFDRLHFVDAGEENYDVWKDFPFDTPHVHLRIEMTSLTLSKFAPLKGWKVRHNLHEYFGEAGRPADGVPRTLLPDQRAKLTRTMISFKAGSDAMPSFDIHHQDVRVHFPDETKKSSSGIVFRYSPLVQYVIPVYRNPGAALRTMVFPLMVTNLSVIASQMIGRGKHFSYGSMESEEAFNARIQTLITILIALFAFLTYARAKLPDVPVTTVMDKCIFVSVASTAVGIVESVVAGKGAIWGDDFEPVAEGIMWANFVFFFILQIYLAVLITARWTQHVSTIEVSKPTRALGTVRGIARALRIIAKSTDHLETREARREARISIQSSKMEAKKQVKKSSTGDFEYHLYGLPVTR